VEATMEVDGFWKSFQFGKENGHMGRAYEYKAHQLP
jgi:hypothetical protein